MPFSIEELNSISAARTQQALQSQFTTQAINPPTWVSVTTPSQGTVVFLLNEPVTDKGQSYLLTGGGIGAPVTGSKSPQMFFYQFSVSANADFSSDTILDSGSSRSYTYASASALYVRARARLVNGPWSDWKPYGSQITGNAAVYRPFEYVVTGGAGGSAVNPSQAMDGDTSTLAAINGGGPGTESVTYGPFSTNGQLITG